jgi:hypothetical protein
MKIRQDFVTNSSSSSFVVAFNDEESIRPELESEASLYRYVDRVLRDIKANHITKEEALHEFKDKMERNIRFDIENYIECKMRCTYSEFVDWKRKPENATSIDRAVKERLSDEFEKFKEKLEGMDYIALVEYDDHCDCELEQEIMPRLGCTVQRFNHH